MFIVTCFTVDRPYKGFSDMDVLKTFDVLDHANEYAHYGYIMDKYGSHAHFESIKRYFLHSFARALCISPQGSTLDIQVIEHEAQKWDD